MHRTSRRRFLLVGGTVAAAMAGCLDRTAPADLPDDTTTATGPTTGTSPGTDTPTDTTTLTTDDETPPGVAWRREVGGSVTTTAAGSDTAFVGTKSGDVVALGSDGSERWTAALDGPIQQVEPSGDLAFAVVGESALFAEQRVVALDAATGEDRWTYQGSWYLEVIGTHEGTVYVARSDDAISPDGETLYAVSRDDGSVQWSGEVGDNSGGLVTPDAVYVPTYGRIYAYSHDGTLLWARNLAEYGYRSIVSVGDGVAFAGVVDEEDGRRQSAIGLSTADGSTRWTVDGWYVTSLVGHDGRLFAGGKHVVEVDPETGETGWQFDAGGSIYDAPIVDGTLFTSGRAIHAVSIEDGSGRWAFESDLHLVTPVAVAGDTVYVHASKSRDDRNRHVVALDPGDGSERWRVAAESELSTPVLVSDRPVAGSEDGVVYGFE